MISRPTPSSELPVSYKYHSLQWGSGFWALIVELLLLLLLPRLGLSFLLLVHHGHHERHTVPKAQGQIAQSHH